MEQWIVDFKENAIYRLDENTRMVHLAFAKMKKAMDDEAFQKLVWHRPNTSSNSLGNQLLHLCGNMTQYVIAGLGEHIDKRNRDAEFNARSGHTADQLLLELDNIVTQVRNTIEHTTSEQLLKKRNVQGFHLSGTGVILHAVEHYSYHTGQIAFWIKQCIDSPLGFYDGMDLTVKNG